MSDEVDALQRRIADLEAENARLLSKLALARELATELMLLSFPAKEKGDE